MIVAVGTDIVNIGRIAKAMQNPAFADRILTPKEQQREITPEYLAGRWAAKESIKKCFPKINRWHQIEITGEPKTPPKITIHHPEFDPHHHRIHVSISHERETAVAFAILEKVS